MSSETSDMERYQGKEVKSQNETIFLDFTNSFGPREFSFLLVFTFQQTCQFHDYPDLSVSKPRLAQSSSSPQEMLSCMCFLPLSYYKNPHPCLPWNGVSFGF
jgi:hypothetical protein